jgi:hypothetical protein
VTRQPPKRSQKKTAKNNYVIFDDTENKEQNSPQRPQTNTAQQLA